ncbi:MAG: hypothetical protein II651_06520, partial [Selenomonas sp.]|nr:hypothetical protein [Selenomonas sp.]
MQAVLRWTGGSLYTGYYCKGLADTAGNGRRIEGVIMEIERQFLVAAVPVLPAEYEVLRQGYV